MGEKKEELSNKKKKCKKCERVWRQAAVADNTFIIFFYHLSFDFVIFYYRHHHRHRQSVTFLKKN